MKRSYLWTGIGMIALGLVCLAVAILWDTPLDSLLCGFSGAFAVPGAMQIWKYFKWTRLETPDSYRRHVEEEQIALRDERKEMLRNKSGRYAYILGLLVAALAILLFSVLDAFGVIEEDTASLMVLSLAGYALFQLVAGWVIYKLLEKRY